MRILLLILAAFGLANMILWSFDYARHIKILHYEVVNDTLIKDSIKIKYEFEGAKHCNGEVHNSITQDKEYKTKDKFELGEHYLVIKLPEDIKDGYITYKAYIKYKCNTLDYIVPKISPAISFILKVKK